MSVCVSDKFMEAVENDEDWVTKFPDTNDLDYDEKWEETEFRKKYEKFHDKFIVSAHVRKHKKEIEAWTAQLFDAYKEVLEVEA